MKKIIFIILLLILSACQYHAFDYNSSSNSQCILECENKMNEYYCMESIPHYSESFMNDEKLSGKCSCYIRNCRK